jgi:hypothetical protein
MESHFLRLISSLCSSHIGRSLINVHSRLTVCATALLYDTFEESTYKSRIAPPVVGLACGRVRLFSCVRVTEATSSIGEGGGKVLKMEPIKQATRSVVRPAQQCAVQAKTSLPPSQIAILKASVWPPTGRGEALKTEHKKSATSRGVKPKIYIPPDTAKYLAGLTPPPKEEAEIPPLLRTLYRALARCAEPGD